jgi:ATP-dependent helicase HrpA
LFCAFRAAFIDSFDAGTTDTIQSRAQFESQLAKHKAALAKHAAGLVKAIDEALTLVAEIRKLCDERYVKSWEHVGADIEQQLKALFMPRFLRETPSGQLLQYPRYLKAMVMRLNKARQGAMERDLETFKQIRPLWQHYLSVAKSKEAAVVEYRWAVEELRVGLFAQELRTPIPVSVKRVAKMWDEIVNKLY